MKKHISRRHLLATAAAMAAVPAAALAQDTTAQTTPPPPPATPDATVTTPPAAPAPADATQTPDTTPAPAGPGVALSVGTYATDADAGLYPMGSYISSDDFHVWPPKAGVLNASWGLTAGPKRYNYVVNEQAAGMIGIYDNSWTKVGEVSSQGDSPCYVSTDASGKWLACANYNTGNVVFFPIDPATGLPGTPVIRQNKGKSKDPDRQAGPHAHFVQFAPGNSAVFSIDLGTDEVCNYSFDPEAGKIGQKTTALRLPKGSGPRHMVFHRDGLHVYIVSELANTITMCEQTNMTTLDAKQTISTLPKDFTGHSQAAEIAINGRGTHLYVSNRGHNSIAVFNIADDGKLTPLQTISCGGDWPRHFVLLEDDYLAAQPRLIVANQNSNNVVPFRVQPDGTLVQQGKILDIPKPVFIGFEIQG